jgi:hypothetical protein
VWGWPGGSGTGLLKAEPMTAGMDNCKHHHVYCTLYHSYHNEPAYPYCNSSTVLDFTNLNKLNAQQAVPCVVSFASLHV